MSIASHCSWHVFECLALFTSRVGPRFGKQNGFLSRAPCFRDPAARADHQSGSLGSGNVHVYSLAGASQTWCTCFPSKPLIYQRPESPVFFCSMATGGPMRELGGTGETGGVKRCVPSNIGFKVVSTRRMTFRPLFTELFLVG